MHPGQAVPLGMTRPSRRAMSLAQRRDTATTGGCRRRLSLMHMVVKGRWDRSSLGVRDAGTGGPQARWPGDDTEDRSPFNLLHVPALEELADLLAAPLLVVGVTGQVVEQPCQAAGRRVVACGDEGT